MTTLNPGTAVIAASTAKAASLSGSGPTIVISVGPITGGVPPYSVDFSHLETFDADDASRRAANPYSPGLFSHISFGGDGVGSGGTAYATGKMHREIKHGGFLYFPPNCYITVTDSAGQSADVRLNVGGLQFNLS